MIRVAFLVSYDAYLYASLSIAKSLKDKNVEACFYILSDFDGISQRLVNNLKSEINNVTNISSDHFLASESDRFDVIFCGVGGKKLSGFLEKFCLKFRHTAGRPMTVTLFPGLTAYNQYAGMAARVKSDIILFNSKRNFDDYKTFCTEFKLDSDNGLLFGFPKLLSLTKKPPVRPAAIKNVLYVDSNIVPSTYEARDYIADRLVAYAEKFTDRKLTVLLRNKPSERNAHQSVYCLKRMILKNNPRLKNIDFSYENVTDILKKTDLCIGVSSTVLTEAIFANIPTAILSDFGIKEELGNVAFLGSGAFRSFTQLSEDDIPVGVDPDWHDENITLPHAHTDALMTKMTDKNTRKIMNENFQYMQFVTKKNTLKKEIFTILKCVCRRLTGCKR